MTIMALNPQKMHSTADATELEWLGAGPMVSGARHVVLLSGGQDSATCLRLAILVAGSENHVTAVSFRYGQRHQVELDAAARFASMMGVRQVTLTIEALAELGGSRLLQGGDVAAAALGRPNRQQVDDLPNTWVPHRNSVFLSLAAALASQVAARYLWIGCSQVDFSGYPDCREAFLERKQAEINASESSSHSLDRQIVAPLLFASKADTFSLADKMHILHLIIKETRTCYHGSTTMNPWGRGCGLCAACELRSKGWNEYADRTR